MPHYRARLTRSDCFYQAGPKTSVQWTTKDLATLFSSPEAALLAALDGSEQAFAARAQGASTPWAPQWMQAMSSDASLAAWREPQSKASLEFDRSKARGRIAPEAFLADSELAGPVEVFHARCPLGWVAAEGTDFAAHILEAQAFASEGDLRRRCSELSIGCYRAVRSSLRIESAELHGDFDGDDPAGQALEAAIEARDLGLAAPSPHGAPARDAPRL